MESRDLRKNMTQIQTTKSVVTIDINKDVSSQGDVRQKSSGLAPLSLFTVVTAGLAVLFSHGGGVLPVLIGLAVILLGHVLVLLRLEHILSELRKGARCETTFPSVAELRNREYLTAQIDVLELIHTALRVTFQKIGGSKPTKEVAAGIRKALQTIRGQATHLQIQVRTSADINTFRERLNRHLVGLVPNQAINI